MRIAAAWLVHLFTASGVVIAFLALEATWRGDWRLALLWLLAALAVDGVDGYVFAGCDALAALRTVHEQLLGDRGHVGREGGQS